MRVKLLFSIILLFISCGTIVAYDWSTNPGDGSESNPYQVSTPDQMNDIGLHTEIWDECFVLTNDIDMGAESNSGYNIIGISYESPFTGCFNGNNHMVSNLRFNDSNRNYVGLFGSLRNDAVIQNLHLVGINIKGKQFVGGLVGSNRNSTIINCSVEGKVSGWNHTGGMLGKNMFSKVYRCWVNADVVATNLFTGGLSGNNQSGEILQCYFIGKISGRETVGGLVGQNTSNGLVAESFSLVDIKGFKSIGGLLGDCHGAFVRNCYTAGNLYGTGQMLGGFTSYIRDSNIQNCYASIIISGPANYIGGFTSGAYNSSIMNCFWDNEVSVQTSDTKNSDLSGVFATNTETMMKAQTFVGKGWDFVGEDINGTDNIWWIDEGNDYPRLRWEINSPPIADAGADIIAYAWIDGVAEVRLDGTGSYDTDGDALDYLWYNDSNELIVTGAEPDVLFGVGEYEVTLVVNDGYEDSEPNLCMVTVLKAIETEAKLIPKSLNRKSNRPYVIGKLTLMGFSENDIDPNEPMVLTPGNIEAERVEILPSKEGADSITLKGFFDNAMLMDAIEDNGDIEVTIVTRLLSGQWVYGTNTVMVK